VLLNYLTKDQKRESKENQKDEPPPSPDDYETKEDYEIAFKKWKKGFDKAMKDFGYDDE
jgi:hypothetical protein